MPDTESTRTEDRGLTLRLDDDTEGHVSRILFTDPSDEDRFLDALKQRRDEPGSMRVTIAPSDEGDTEGHTALRDTAVRILLDDEDDTEGHAISLHFPTIEEAGAFRRRLLATGLIVGTVTLGALSATNLPAFQVSTDTGAGGSAVSSQVGPMDAHEAPAFQASAATATSPDSDIGLMDASGAAAAAGSAATATSPDSDIGLMDATGAAGAAGSSVNHEPPASKGLAPR